MKVVINTWFGGFAVSEQVRVTMGWESEYDGCYDYSVRTDPKLIELVEQLGDKASASGSCLRVVTLPENVTDWRINEYDGAESIIYVLNGKIHDL